MHPTRRDLLTFAAAAACGPRMLCSTDRPIVSVTRIPNGNIDYAVEHAIELLGGIRAITRDKQRVLIKPNLLGPDPNATTKPAVVRTLARLMQSAGRDVSIAEGSAAGAPFNVRDGETFRTTKKDLLNGLQKYVFDQLGYSELARTLRIPLINLHTGDLVDVKLSGAFVFPTLTMHRALMDTDLLCSVPMMKTHTLAHVTLGMKNLIGAYPGAAYQSVRGRMHDAAAKVEPSGTAAAIVDMVRANKVGLVVVDASTAMEGNGPVNGSLVPMQTIVAGTNPLATDMVAASLMGFDPEEVPTFTWARKAGMRPERLQDIEVRGERIESVRRKFVRPVVTPWSIAGRFWATREI